MFDLFLTLHDLHTVTIAAHIYHGRIPWPYALVQICSSMVYGMGIIMCASVGSNHGYRFGYEAMSTGTGPCWVWIWHVWVRARGHRYGYAYATGYGYGYAYTYTTSLADVHRIT